MLIGLYTSRVILAVLGVDNFGIYNVVGGTIAMFSMFTSSMSSAISRFITFGLGKNNLDNLKSIFTTSITIQLIIGIVIVIIAEIVGIWMINTTLNIPSDKIYASHWVLQFCILGFFTGLLSIPFNACIIAHERMKVFAYIGIIEAVFKLIFVFSLYVIPFDKLIVYSFFLFLTPFILQIIYVVYCRSNFHECRIQLRIDRQLLKEMLGFAWWGFFGNAAYLFNTQGVNIAINIFFNVALNAARGVVAQVGNAVSQFVNNFMTAFSPQITKSCASGEYDYMYLLVCRGAKFSFFLILLFLIPLEFEADYVLKLWLKDVPESSALFLRWSLICTTIMLLGNTCLTAVMATGKIRNYQIFVSIVGCLVFPLTWIAYQMGMPAYITYPIYAVIYFILIFIRVYFLQKLLGFNPVTYLKDVLLPIFNVSICVIIPITIIYFIMDSSFLRLLAITLSNCVFAGFIIYYIGLKNEERAFVKAKISRFLTNKYSV